MSHEDFRERINEPVFQEKSRGSQNQRIQVKTPAEIKLLNNKQCILIHVASMNCITRIVRFVPLSRSTHCCVGCDVSSQILSGAVDSHSL